jgi:hypothetical protein
LSHEGEVTMTPAKVARLASDLRVIGAFLDDGFIGILRVRVASGNPDGSDVNLTITYPDWKSIGSKL